MLLLRGGYNRPQYKYQARTFRVVQETEEPGDRTASDDSRRRVRGERGECRSTSFVESEEMCQDEWKTEKREMRCQAKHWQSAIHHEEFR